MTAGISYSLTHHSTLQKTEMRPGERGYITRPFFLPDEVPASNIFKIPQVIDRIYTWEVDGNPEDEFKACVEANGLTGLYFEPVWSGEDGIIPYKLHDFGSP